MPPRKLANKSVWVVPPIVTFNGKAHATWTHTGNLNRGRTGAKVTAKEGVKQFRTYREAVAFGKIQALRMGEGTELGLNGVKEDCKFYTVKNGKFVRGHY